MGTSPHKSCHSETPRPAITLWNWPRSGGALRAMFMLFLLPAPENRKVRLGARSAHPLAEAVGLQLLSEILKRLYKSPNSIPTILS